ncbi:DUF2399 domain-containing protein [Streptomyces sp. CWNU-52B]|uniref:DUF2399 domain-containing protein n=1 Tax=unclassified Streptomyces TaxID=2593676 RepID=UPI0039C4304B
MSGSGDVLYDVERRVLAGLPVGRKGPSTVTEQTFEDRLADLVAEYIATAAGPVVVADPERRVRELAVEHAGFWSNRQAGGRGTTARGAGAGRADRARPAHSHRRPCGGPPRSRPVRGRQDGRTRYPAPPRTAPAALYICENPAVLAGAADAYGNACPLLVCLQGQPPSAAALALLGLLHDNGTSLHHHGDFGWGGLRTDSDLRELSDTAHSPRPQCVHER